MTNKQITVNERDLAIIRFAVGSFGTGSIDNLKNGRPVFLDDEPITLDDLESVVSAINSITASSVVPEVLTDAEKFLVAGAFGALIQKVDTPNANQQSVQKILDLIDQVQVKLRLIPNGDPSALPRGGLSLTTKL